MGSMGILSSLAGDLSGPGVDTSSASSRREASHPGGAEGRQVLRASEAQQPGGEEVEGRAEGEGGRDRAEGVLPGEGERRPQGAGEHPRERRTPSGRCWCTRGTGSGGRHRF
ncbi:hypothetical protein CEXT_280421 [Caerostris extrusa]|uniref:Uncharacterized protein n=1 Tax=Caerostris extrusa TaxID=172846 RepID=A0AAV4UW43_CAEEX|nr:hypothetical protein CEXT_280421 [Caerostris extrusa]